MVIAVPLPMVIKRHEEEVLPLEDVDDLRRVGRADDGVAQRRAEPAENGGAREEMADLARLAAESLYREIVNDEPVVAGELADEGARRGVTAKGERREV